MAASMSATRLLHASVLASCALALQPTPSTRSRSPNIAATSKIDAGDAKLVVVKPGQPGYNVPNMAMYGGNSIKRMSPGEFVSFYGMPEKETGHVPSQYRWATEHAAALVSAKLIPESMSLASQNALAKALIFLMDVGGYTYGEAMILASVTVDIRVAQLVDKPAIGMEAVVDLSIFKGATHAKFMAHLGK